MVIFNECRIDKEGKNLIVDVSVDSLSYYENIYLKSITIDTNETFIENGPSSNYIYNDEFNVSDVRVKRKRLKFSYKELGLDNFDDNILFVYIGVGGIPEPDTPCGMDNKHSVAVAVNMRPVYNLSLIHISEPTRPY